jgi:hypothetical protein
MISYPFWISPSSLGTVMPGHSFTENPTSLFFGDSADQPCVVTLLNGELPPGVTYTQVGFSVQLGGRVTGSVFKDTYLFTLRINNGRFSADQTFQLGVTQSTVQSFEWVTSTLVPLGSVYGSEPVQLQISAESIPPASVSYQITNLDLITAGVSIVGNSGEITINLAWQPNRLYRAGTDVVFNQGLLYECVTGGTSTGSVGPVGTGATIVDSVYPPWEPNRFYPINTIVTNDAGKIYLCVREGVSGAGPGPTGPGRPTDEGAVLWNFLDQAVVWDQVPSNTIRLIPLMCEATSGGATISASFDVQLISTPASPLWITPSAQLAQFPSQTVITVQLVALDPDLLPLSWSSSNLPSWLNLSNIGELWGTTPLVTSNTSYVFDVSVSDGTLTETRQFTVLVTNQIAGLDWVTDGDLGMITHGQPSTLSVLATSPLKGVLVRYGLAGGMLPLGTQLDHQTGQINGFVEYHAENKSYQFEISATDGAETIIKQFDVTVLSDNRGIYWSVHIPLLGKDRFSFITNNSNSLVDDADLYLPNQPGWGRIQQPMIPVISGIKEINAADLRHSLSNWMHNFRITFGDLRMRPTQQTDRNLVYLSVKDADGKPQWRPNSSYAQGDRVSTSRGDQYAAVVAGTSSVISPQGTGNNIVDGSVTWSWQGQPLPVVERTYALPWYPYHTYQLGQTVVNDGVRYLSLQSGKSGGGPGPVAHTLVADGDITWTATVDGAVVANQYWPANIHNMRQQLINQIGYSNSWGRGASAELVVNASSGEITSATLVSGGSGYYLPPSYNITSMMGSGAQLSLLVGIISASVTASSSGLAPFAEFEVDLGTGQPAKLRIASTNLFGQAVTVEVLHSGLFERIPSSVITVPVGSGTISIKLDAGLVQTTVTHGGSGYLPGDRINFAGQEFDSQTYEFVDQLEPGIGVNHTLGTSKVDVSMSTNLYQGNQLVVNLVQAQLQGIQWQGRTRFDDDQFTLDADSTRFVEFEPSSQTTWDNSGTTWDNDQVTFDVNPLMSYPTYSQTTFDDGATIFDYYATLFDQSPVTTASRWSRRWTWFFGKPFSF